jgi:acetylornithine deacetylase/succinyl-diaminopimelate desuccinylase-like protein
MPTTNGRGKHRGGRVGTLKQDADSPRSRRTGNGVVAKVALAAVFTAAALGSTASHAQARAESASAEYRRQHSHAIIEEFAKLLSMPNVASNIADVDSNAAFLRSAFERRGFSTQLLKARPGTPGAIFGELRSPGAARTIMIYAHYDGQPVDQPGWRSPPFAPTMRSGADPANSPVVDWRRAAEIGPEWRLYARSASDDKAPIQALLTALDVLAAGGRRPGVNIKVFLEGEEEAGSDNLREILRQHRRLLDADLFVLADGPRHASGRPQIFFGARGITAANLKVYGPIRPLHDGHYGNWAPNPAAMLVNLLAALRDGEGNINIPGMMRGVRPLTAAERQAIAALPNDDDRLRRELAIGRPEGKGTLAQMVTRPALNIRGLKVGNVGRSATNTIATSAEGSIDFRLVPDQDPAAVKAIMEAYLRKLGWYVIDREPTNAERLAHARIVRVDWEHGYSAYRTDLANGKEVVEAVERAVGERPLLVPMLGGSVPMSIFASELKMPVVGLPVANADNNQHAENENIRIQNLWDAIDIFVALISKPRR